MSDPGNSSEILSGDAAPDRACRDIPVEACRQEPWNFTANAANGAASKLAEQLAGPNLVLPWLLQVLGAPVWMLGFLMPIKQGFSLLPQMVAAGRIRQLSRRKWVWVGAALVQAGCLLLLLPLCLWWPPLAAGFAVLFLLILFSAASGTASVAFQDVIGKTIDKGQRGRLLARRALLGGLLTTVAGLVLTGNPSMRQGLLPVLLLVLGAALLWLLAAGFFALIREYPGATQGGRNAAAEVRAGLCHYREQPGFRRFLRARGLLLTVELITPFLVLHAGQVLDLELQHIGSLVIAIGFAQVISSPFWGRMADRASQNVMTLSALIAMAAVMLALALTRVPLPWLQTGGYLLVFVLIGLAEAGVRLGRKTYLVDAVPAAERATYTAFSNSLIGFIALLSGAAGLLAQWLGATPLLLVVLGLLCCAVAACRTLPAAERMLDDAPSTV